MKRVDAGGFRIICVILIITGTGLVSTALYTIAGTPETAVFHAPRAAEGVLQILAAAAGLVALKETGRAGTCQIAGILMLAVAFITAACDIFTGQAAAFIAAGTAVTLTEAVLYYRMSKKLMSSRFWDGIKAAEMESIPEGTGKWEERTDPGPVESSYVISSSGREEGRFARVEVMEPERFLREYRRLTGRRLNGDDLRSVKHCSAGILGESVAGTLTSPPVRGIRNKGLSCGFYMDRDVLIFADYSGMASSILAELNSVMPLEKETPGQVLFEFLEYMIEDDFMYLAEYEKRLDILEDNMTDDALDVPKDFDGFVSETRKELRSLTGYYKLLREVADVLEEAFTQMEDNRSRQLFASLSDKAGRLYGDAADIAEYAMQIRDIYQSKISIRQNKVMQILTIVTTVFMPLTLITGWYGMNFHNMPELGSRYGYLIVTLVSIAVIAAEFIIFKIKKWF